MAFVVMFVSFFAGVLGVVGVSHLFGDKPSETVIFGFGLLSAMIAGIELVLSELRKHFRG
jgi:hypothetical protein